MRWRHAAMGLCSSQLKNRNLGEMPFDEFVETVTQEARTRGEVRLLDRFDTETKDGETS